MCEKFTFHQTKFIAIDSSNNWLMHFYEEMIDMKFSSLSFFPKIVLELILVLLDLYFILFVIFERSAIVPLRDKQEVFSPRHVKDWLF